MCSDKKAPNKQSSDVFKISKQGPTNLLIFDVACPGRFELEGGGLKKEAAAALDIFIEDKSGEAIENLLLDC